MIHVTVIYLCFSCVFQAADRMSSSTHNYRTRCWWKVRPGDRVQVTGIYRAAPVSWQENWCERDLGWFNVDIPSYYMTSMILECVILFNFFCI